MKLSVNQAFLREMGYLYQSSLSKNECLNWLDSASIVQCENVFVFDHLRPKGKLSRPIDWDETGMECSLNHFHLDCDDIESAVGLAMLIFEKVSRLWRSSFETHVGAIRQIVSIASSSIESGRYELTYRFHVVREGQSWLAPDLDKYDDIVLVL